jgi:hypothetical protein
MPPGGPDRKMTYFGLELSEETRDARSRWRKSDSRESRRIQVTVLTLHHLFSRT